MTTESLSVTIEGELLTVEIGTVAAPAGGGGGSAAWGDITGTLSAQTDLSAALALKAPLASPTLTGTPAAPTAAGGTSTTQIATTAFTAGEITTHAGATDPHGDRAFATSAVSTHAAATDPHGDRAYADGLAGNYAAAGHNHSGTYQPLATVLTNTTAAFTTAQETKLSGIETAADVTDAGNVGAAIDGATAKTTPVDADTVPLIDSAASNVLKKLSWANIKATAKTYFDTLYQAASATLTTWATITPGTGIATALAVNVGTAGAPVINGGALGTPSSATLTNATGLPPAGITQSGATSSQVLAWNGSVWAPATPAAGAGTDTFLIRSPLQNEPPASAFATLDTRNSIPCLDFDAAADESAIFSGFAPEAIVLTSGIITRIVWAATSATSGNVRWRVKFERRTTDQDSDSWDTATEATDAANGTSGICTVTEITCTTIDSIVAGDSFRVCVTRVGTDGTNDTMTGDAELFGFELRAA